jgi:hypothetical protein
MLRCHSSICNESSLDIQDVGEYVTDNYNHIFEQPTLFYATVIYIFLMEHTDSIHVYLAWGYVATRMIHTAIQLTTNNVSWRATIFSISGLCLIAMIVKESLFFI